MGRVRASSKPMTANASPHRPLDALLVCRSSAIEHLRALAIRIAAGDARVLITGESGVGKDVVAHLIHARSPRARKPFVTVSAVGLPELGLAAQIFGPTSVPGQANGKPQGAIADAQGGTLFIDEISELPLTLQGRLLRFLESGLAPSDDVPSDVRVLASTTHDLGELVAHGQFREDLMYRLDIVHLHVPPLRQRREDVRPLAEWMAKRLDRSLACTPEAWTALEQYYWPGNVRELSNVVEQLTWTGPQDVVQVEELPESVRGYAAGGVRPVRERRRQVADDLYSGLVEGTCNFWDDVYEMFIRRDLTRDDLRGVIKRGLTATRGSYRSLLVLFGIDRADYKRLLNFLAAHECALDFREFRAPRADDRASRRLEPARDRARSDL